MTQLHVYALASTAEASRIHESCKHWRGLPLLLLDRRMRAYATHLVAEHSLIIMLCGSRHLCNAHGDVLPGRHPTGARLQTSGTQGHAADAMVPSCSLKRSNTLAAHVQCHVAEQSQAVYGCVGTAVVSVRDSV
jgi:hypothetical protein